MRMELTRRVLDLGVWLRMQWKQRVSSDYYSTMNYISIQLLLIIIMITRTHRLNNLFLRRFSSIANPQLTDWEYTTKIQKSLHNNDINEALKYLINSHLEGQVLDMHVFRNYFLKVEKLKSGLTYEEIGYKLYREHFKPNLLVLEWMNALARSSNKSTIKLLEEDFKSLKVDMPKVDKVPEEEPFKAKIEEKKKQVNNQDSKVPVPSPPTVLELIQSSPAQEKEKSMNALQKLQNQATLMEVPNSIKSIVESVMGRGSKIVLHNISIEYEDMPNMEEMSQMAENMNKHQYVADDEEIVEQDEDEDDMQWIKKIKIEKIQIMTDKNEIPKDQGPHSNFK